MSLVFTSITLASASAQNSPQQEELEGRRVEHQGVGCDPVSPHPVAIPAPEGKGIKCGDGLLREYVASCAKYCGHVGCGRDINCDDAPVTCTQAREVCDGKNLGGRSCKKLGFFGGRLKCASSCQSFDVSSCQICRSNSKTSCYFAKVSKEMLDTSLSATPTPTVLSTERGISLAWQFLDGGAMGIALVSIGRDGRVHVSERQQMAGWAGASYPRMISDSRRLVLVARRDFQLIIQEFSLDGKPQGQIFSVAGDILLDLSWAGDLVRMTTRSRYSSESVVQFVDLKKRQIDQAQVSASQPNQGEVQNISAGPIRKKAGPSALASSSILTQKFWILSGKDEFEGAFVLPSNRSGDPQNHWPQVFQPQTNDGALVIAIRKNQ